MFLNGTNSASVLPQFCRTCDSYLLRLEFRRDAAPPPLSSNQFYDTCLACDEHLRDFLDAGRSSGGGAAGGGLAPRSAAAAAAGGGGSGAAAAAGGLVPRAAAAAAIDPSNGNDCNKCGQAGHYASNCPSSSVARPPTKRTVSPTKRSVSHRDATETKDGFNDVEVSSDPSPRL